jgi:dethiobiotin synthetase
VNSILAKGLFVTGTDTGVGKTLVSCALIRLLREEGLNAAGFKPVSCGMDDGRWSDAEALRTAGAEVETLDATCPLRFKAPLAPTLAAAEEGQRVQLDVARRALAAMNKCREAVVVEGVGGWLVPLDEKTLIADFAVELNWPVLVVGRTGLGTINHTLLTVRDVERRGLPLAGVILSDSGGGLPQSGSRSEIERLSGRRVLAVLPHCDGDGEIRVQQAVRELGGQLRASALLG